jgi:CubicO group peptidase (beta-lactamase class C family)
MGRWPRARAWLRGVTLLPLLAALALATCAGPAQATRGTPSAPSPTPNTAAAARIDAYLTGELKARRFSGAALVAQRGVVLLRKGYGLADQAQGVPNRPETQFRIASLSKQFTATAILLLQARGKLSVDDPICRYLASCPDAWRPITIRMCLTHTSGIPNLADGDIADYSQPLTPAQLLALIQAKPLDFTPGARFEYSNAGYNALGVVVERVSGEPYARFLRDSIFAPLHMDATGYDVNHPPLPSHATGYTTWGRPADYFDISLPFAAGGVASTVDDLYRWDRTLAAGMLLPASAEADMLGPQVPLCPPGCPAHVQRQGYGYGWYAGDEAWGPVQYHFGDLLGYRALIARYPRQDAVVIVLANLETVNPDALRAQIEALLYQAS